MKIISLYLSFLMTLTLFPVQGTELEKEEKATSFAILRIKGPEDFTQQAEQAIKDKELPKNYQQLEEKFKPLLYPEAEVLFQSYFTILLDPFFPKPQHNDDVIRGGWRCLYKKMAYGRTLPLEEAKKYQIEAIYKLLSFHKKRITDYNAEKGNRIPPFKCESCLQLAKEEVGILSIKIEEEKNNI